MLVQADFDPSDAEGKIDDNKGLPILSVLEMIEGRENWVGRTSVARASQSSHQKEDWGEW